MFIAFVANFAAYFECSILTQEIAEALQLGEAIVGNLLNQGLEESLQVFYGPIARFNIGRRNALTCFRGSAGKESECRRSPMNGELVLKVRVMGLLFMLAEGT